MSKIVLLAHNLRSTHNVGALLRTAEGLGVDKVYLTGYTPYPLADNEVRLPHLASKLDKQISKTALGAEKLVAWQYDKNVHQVISQLKKQDFTVAALEQVPNAISLSKFRPPAKIAIIVGREVEGLEPDVLAACDLAVAIPMSGQKESFNVAQAAAMALYHCKYLAK